MKAIQGKTPYQITCEWFRKKPEIFLRNPTLVKLYFLLSRIIYYHNRMTYIRNIFFRLKINSIKIKRERICILSLPITPYTVLYSLKISSSIICLNFLCLTGTFTIINFFLLSSNASIIFETGVVNTVISIGTIFSFIMYSIV